jgi:hypothetical protein
MARMDRLENAVNGIRDDITKNMARADRAHVAAENTLDEVRLLGEQVNAMERQIQRLQTRHAADQGRTLSRRSTVSKYYSMRHPPMA